MIPFINLCFVIVLFIIVDFVKTYSLSINFDKIVSSLKTLDEDETLLVQSGKVPKLPDDVVGISIITGLQGLGRGQDKEKLLEFITVMAQALGADVMRQYVNLDEAIKRLATSIGIETENLVKSGEEIAAEQQQMQQQELIRSLGSAAVGSPLLDPKKQAEAGLINLEVTANATQEG